MSAPDSLYDPEDWRDVPGWEDVYRVSSHGRIEVLPRFVRSKGNCYRLKSRRFHSGGRQGGYRGFMASAGGRHERIAVHRLVCAVFNGPPANPSDQVRHLDGSRDNNRASNLAWGTAKQNAEDRELHGTDPKGERGPSARLTELEVLAIRAAYAPGYGALSRLGRAYGVTSSQILNIVTRKQWAHI